MQPRPPLEYLEDALLAEKLNNEAIFSMKKRDLEEKASLACIAYFAVQGTNSPHELELKIKYEAAQNALEQLDAKSFSSSSALIKNSIKNNAAAPKALAKRFFSVAEAERMKEHNKNLPAHLQKLMDAALLEDVSLELMSNPVFIRREGKIYDAKTVSSWLKDKKEALCPYNQAITFTKDDVIPCNSVIESMEHLLAIIENKKIDPQIIKNPLSLLPDSKSQVRSRIPENVITIIEMVYQKLPDKHKLLFNTLCRDSITKKIMDDPVLLPDGYLYDKGTAIAYLKAKGTCPRNNEIAFTQADITPCAMVCQILDQLRENALEEMKKKESENVNSAVAKPLK
jgi:hypothetical protein